MKFIEALDVKQGKNDAHTEHNALLCPWKRDLMLLSQLAAVQLIYTDKSASWQPQGCPLPIRFVNWAMHRCDFGKDILRLYSHNGAKQSTRSSGLV